MCILAFDKGLSKSNKNECVKDAHALGHFEKGLFLNYFQKLVFILKLIWVFI